jgi:hypothetical protein
MKYAILLAMFLSVTAKAQEVSTEASEANPKHITEIRNGKVMNYDGDEWIVVKKRPKSTKPKVKPAPPVPQVVEKTVTVEKTVFVEKKTYQKNRVTLLAGEGPRNGMETYNYGSTLETRSRVGAIGGLEYQYSFTQHWSAALQVQTNPSGLIGIGYGW